MESLSFFWYLTNVSVKTLEHPKNVGNVAITYRLLKNMYFKALHNNNHCYTFRNPVNQKNVLNLYSFIPCKRIQKPKNTE